MEGGAGRGMECQNTMDGKGSNRNCANVEKEIPSCCLKAKASVPEIEAKCHSTVVSGWFSESQSCSGHHLLFSLFHSWIYPSHPPITLVKKHYHHSLLSFSFVFSVTGKAVYFNNPMWPGGYYSPSA